MGTDVVGVCGFDAVGNGLAWLCVYILSKIIGSPDSQAGWTTSELNRVSGRRAGRGGRLGLRETHAVAGHLLEVWSAVVLATGTGYVGMSPNR